MPDLDAIRAANPILSDKPHVAGPVCDRYEHHVHLIDGSIRTGGSHQPGDPHEYEITCKVCGRVGMVRLLVDPVVVS